MLVMSVGICYESFDGSRRWGRLFLGAAVGVFAIAPLFTGNPDANYFTWFNTTMSVGFIVVGIQEHLSLGKLITSVNQSLSPSE